LERVLVRLLIGAVIALTLVLTGPTVLAATAGTNEAVATHKLILAVEKNLAPAGEKKLAVLVLISQNGGAPAGAVARPGKPLTVLQETSGLYRVKAEIESRCKGGCGASYRVSGSADHKLAVIPHCRPEGSGFVCSRVEIVRVY
jgi:hypothetical protein